MSGGDGQPSYPALPPGQSCAGITRCASRREEFMSAAEQAFLLTGELFVLSFLAIGAFWFADKLRRGLTGKV